MQNETHNDLKTFWKQLKTLVATKTTATAIPLLQTIAAIMILKSEDQRVHICCDHSGTYVTTTTSDNRRSINMIPSISIKEQLRDVGLQNDVQFKEYQKLH